MQLITEPTVSDATKKAIIFERRRQAGLENLKATAVGLFRSFWYPIDGITPQQLAAEFGTNTVTAFTQHAATMAFLESQGIEVADEDKIPPANKYTYVINNDGTVTITDILKA